MKRLLLTSLLGIAISLKAFGESPFDEIRNTASPACTAKVSAFLTTLNQYWAIPSLQNLVRVDNLSPVLISQNAFQGITSGTQSLSYYIQNSHYVTEDRKIDFVVYGGRNLSIYHSTSAIPLSSTVTLSFGFPFPTAPTCVANQKWSIGYRATDTVLGYSSLRFSSFPYSGAVKCDLSLNDIAAVCANPSTTMNSVLSSATINISQSTNPNGVAVYYRCQNSSSQPVSDSIGFRNSLLSITSGATLANFCALFQN